MMLITLTNKFAGNGADVGDKWYVNVETINAIRACKASCVGDKDFSIVYTDYCTINAAESAEEIYQMLEDCGAIRSTKRCMKEEEVNLHYFKGDNND